MRCTLDSALSGPVVFGFGSGLMGPTRAVGQTRAVGVTGPKELEVMGTEAPRASHVPGRAAVVKETELACVGASRGSLCTPTRTKSDDGRQ